jgi:hypothetical protein
MCFEILQQYSVRLEAAATSARALPVSLSGDIRGSGLTRDNYIDDGFRGFVSLRVKYRNSIAPHTGSETPSDSVMGTPL